MLISVPVPARVGPREVGILVRASAAFLFPMGQALEANARIVMDLAGQVLRGQEKLP
jgi:hypothetical protein